MVVVGRGGGEGGRGQTETYSSTNRNIPATHSNRHYDLKSETRHHTQQDSERKRGEEGGE